jgi:hypothetical protein
MVVWAWITAERFQSEAGLFFEESLNKFRVGGNTAPARKST